MPVDFSMTNHRFPMSSGGNRLLCLYEAASGRNVGFCRGGEGGGGVYDNSHSIQIYGQDRGAPLDARQGTGESSAQLLQACQSKCLSEQLGAILYILLCLSSLCLLLWTVKVLHSRFQIWWKLHFHEHFIV